MGAKNPSQSPREAEPDGFATGHLLRQGSTAPYAGVARPCGLLAEMTVPCDLVSHEDEQGVLVSAFGGISVIGTSGLPNAGILNSSGVAGQAPALTSRSSW